MVNKPEGKNKVSVQRTENVPSSRIVKVICIISVLELHS